MRTNSAEAPETPAVVPPPATVAAKIQDFFRAFADLLHVPRGFWYINFAFMIDSMAYFGILTLHDGSYLPTVLIKNFGVNADSGDWWGSVMVSMFTGLVTLFMIGIGGLVERIGIRLGVALAILLCLVGRVIYSGAPLMSGGWPLIGLLGVALLVIALGEGIMQPLCYAGIKQFTDEKTNAMGYGLLYAIMNLGIVFIGWLSPLIRVPLDDIVKARAEGLAEPHSFWGFLADWGVTSGFMGVHWACTAITALGLILFLVFFTRRVEAAKIRSQEVSEAEKAAAAALPWHRRAINYFVEGPFSNARFVFFIFMLLPVQTLFAHQWLTIPPYILRAYSGNVADRMEWLVNWTNPAIIFFGVPIATALTRRINVYTMMIVGSLVSAVPTFLLCGGPHLSLLMTYLVLFSVGEALWQPRFLQYAAELAPKGKVAQYMGLANVPWITAKMTTGLYSGYVLGRFCPEVGPKHTEGMWLLYGVIALSSPIGLLLARKWVMAGLHKIGQPAAVAV